MNKQSEASKRWQEKAELKVKGFKLKKELIKRFEVACKSRGEAQADVISKLMEEYIKDA